MRKNPWEEEPQYIANVNKAIAKRFEEIGITDQCRRGWEFETEFLEGEMILVAQRNTYDGETYELIFKPDEKLSVFLEAVAEFKAYMVRTKGGTTL